MFPYPSGAGLHVGHPLGLHRHRHRLPATCACRASTCCTRWATTPSACRPSSTPSRHGVHPRETTDRTSPTSSGRSSMLGLSYDWDRQVATTDVGLLQVDAVDLPAAVQQLVRSRPPSTARPIGDLMQQLQNGKLRRRPRRRARVHGRVRRHSRPIGGSTARRTPLVRTHARAAAPACIDEQRLAYMAEVPVNWCPALGTVLANEEVTNEAAASAAITRSISGRCKQWMLRITAYADRLLADLDLRGLARADQAHAAQLDRPQRRRRGGFRDR